MTIIDKQINKLPQQIIFCKKCSVSNQRPRIAIDKDGICGACTNHKNKNKINWLDRENELIELCKEYKSKDGSYDVVVPSSGEKIAPMYHIF